MRSRRVDDNPVQSAALCSRLTPEDQYHFANDLGWSGGPGYYFIRNRETILGLQFSVTGEHKNVDRFRGKAAEDTGITSVFLGPRVVASRGRWSAEVDV